MLTLLVSLEANAITPPYAYSENKLVVNTWDGAAMAMQATCLDGGEGITSSHQAA